MRQKSFLLAACFFAFACAGKQKEHTNKSSQLSAHKDICQLNLPFDETLFQRYYREDTLKFVLRNKSYERLTDRQLEDSLYMFFRDGSNRKRQEREDMLGYASKRGLPDAFAIIGGFLPCFEATDKRRLAYLLKAVKLGSPLGFDYLSSSYHQEKNYEKAIETDSIASARGLQAPSYRLYFLYSKGVFWGEQGSTKPDVRKEFLNSKKAAFYFDRALQQKHHLALYQKGVSLLGSNRMEAFQFLIGSYESFVKLRDPTLPDYYNLIKTLEKEFPKEWEAYLAKNPKPFGN